MVLLALRQVEQARENLRQSLADTPHGRDFPDTLARVPEAGAVTMTELAEWTDLSRSRLYALLAQADAER